MCIMCVCACVRACAVCVRARARASTHARVCECVTGPTVLGKPKRAQFRRWPDCPCPATRHSWGGRWLPPEIASLVA